jgi:predicted TIM-barrel fold metal-dependent hydrolase
MLDISQLRVVDGHCHPFSQETRELDLSQFVSSTDVLGVFNPSFLVPGDALRRYADSSEHEKRQMEAKYRIAAITGAMKKHSQSLLLYRSMLHELSCLLGCGENAREIVSSRNAKSAEYRSYLKELFADANISTLLVDDGYSELAVEHTLPHLKIEDFMKYVPVNVARVTRIEPLLQESLDTSHKFSDFFSSLTEQLDEAVTRKGAVAFKSLIAYRSGLDVGNPTESQAREDFDRYKQARDTRLKALRDFVLRRVLKKCLDLDIPLQLHTGIGDVDILLDKCNPMHLFPLLKDRELRHAKVVLVHCGYPYVMDAAYLTNVLPNVYLDLSVVVPYATANMSNRILEVLELAPVSKILYASDATQIPEMHWLSAKLGKRALQYALQEIIGKSLATETEAEEMAEMILANNAKTLYRLNAG